MLEQGGLVNVQVAQVGVQTIRQTVASAELRAASGLVGAVAERHATCPLGRITMREPDRAGRVSEVRLQRLFLKVSRW